PAYSQEIERMAVMMCSGDTDPALFAQAVRIAECDVLLRCVRNEKVAAIERLGDPTTLALARQQRLARVVPHLKVWSAGVDLAFFERQRLKARVDTKLKEHGWDEVNWDLVPQTDWRQVAIYRRDEYYATYEALLDLERLARYERRARSRQKRAMRAFMA